MFKFDLAAGVKDRITSFYGVITARAEYLIGSNQYLIESMDHTGRPIEWWTDETRLQLVKPGEKTSEETK